MANLVKQKFLEDVRTRYGNLRKLPNSLSLFDIGDSALRIYIRYSKVHNNSSAFYGLREEDLKQLAGQNSLVCYLWDDQEEPLVIPFVEFEDVFNSLDPASDGQFKVQVFFQQDAKELYIAKSGRFNVERFLGWNIIDEHIERDKLLEIPEFSHSQVQTLIGSIGNAKGYDVWIPPSDRNNLDWNVTEKFQCRSELPQKYDQIKSVVKEIDIIWINRGSSELSSIFEVEHSTPIYSGLLRFNDLHLIESEMKSRFNIVSNMIRRDSYLRQINRPTFKMSGLSEICNFLDYKDVYGWFVRTIKR